MTDGLITQARVEQIKAELEAAGPEWPAAARRLPEYGKHSLGVPAGEGVHRPWLLLVGDHERYDIPVRIVRHESGVWFLKGEYLRDVEERADAHRARG